MRLVYTVMLRHIAHCYDQCLHLLLDDPHRSKRHVLAVIVNSKLNLASHGPYQAAGARSQLASRPATGLGGASASSGWVASIDMIDDTDSKLPRSW